MIVALFMGTQGFFNQIFQQSYQINIFNKPLFLSLKEISKLQNRHYGIVSMDLLGTGCRAQFGKLCGTLDGVTSDMTIIFTANAMRKVFLFIYVYETVVLIAIIKELNAVKHN
jgi:hypothetical protein